MKTLLLIPTLLEANCLAGVPDARLLLSGPVSWRGVDLALTGMGPVDAGVTASRHLARGEWGRCILAGLAGAYEGRGFEPPSLVEVRSFVMDGAGVLGPSGVQAWEDLGLPESVRGLLEPTTHERVGSAPTGLPEAAALTVSASSATRDVARARAADWPSVQIEEMEGFAVARACRLSGVPLTCIRAVSNRCGDREKSRWYVSESMTLIQERLDSLIP